MKYYLKLFVFPLLALGSLSSMGATSTNDFLSVSEEEKKAYEQLFNTVKDSLQETLKFNEQLKELDEKDPRYSEIEDTAYRKEHDVNKKIAYLGKIIDPNNKIFYDYILSLFDKYGPQNSIREYKPYDSCLSLLDFLTPPMLDKFNPSSARIMRQLGIIAEQNSNNELSDEELYKQEDLLFKQLINLPFSYTAPSTTNYFTLDPQIQSQTQIQLLEAVKYTIEKSLQEEQAKINQSPSNEILSEDKNIQTPDTKSLQLEQAHHNRKNIVTLCKTLDLNNQDFYDHALKLMDQYGPGNSKKIMPYDFIYKGILLIFVPFILDTFNPTAANTLREIIVYTDQRENNFLDKATFYPQIIQLYTKFLNS